MKSFLVAMVASFPSAALAQAFTFEELTPGFYSSIVQTIGGQTLIVTPLPVPPPFGSEIVVVDPHTISLLGTRSLVGLAGRIQLFGVTGMQFSFLNPVSAITFAFGDNGGDDDSPARIQAFDPFNNLLGIFDTPYPAEKNDGATRTLTFGGAGASSFIVSSGSGLNSFPFSMDFPGDNFYWEVAASTPIAAPEPAPVALVGSALILLHLACRRARRRGPSGCASFES